MIEKFEHTPVMLHEVLKNLHPEPGDVFVDCTLGGAGHSVQVAKMLGSDGVLIGIDQDPLARKFAREKLESLEKTCSGIPNIVIANANFSELDEVLLNIPVAGVDCILFDLGVSSVQLDVLERGFSYHDGAPLDMRMNTEGNDLTAEIIVNDSSETELEHILRVFGEEKCSKQIARNICKTRETARIETSDQLVEIVKSSIPNKLRRKGGHPAKRTFQALRIAVNDELTCLEEALTGAIRWLNVGGRICVISYHSLEDRRVKDAFRSFENRCTCPADVPVCVCQRKPILKTKPRGVILPSVEEVKNNPRARSAKMRCAVKVKD